VSAFAVRCLGRDEPCQCQVGHRSGGGRKTV
jgi:hypothetical protein